MLVRFIWKAPDHGTYERLVEINKTATLDDYKNINKIINDVVAEWREKGARRIGLHDLSNEVLLRFGHSYEDVFVDYSFYI